MAAGVLLHDVVPIAVGVWLIIAGCFVVAALLGRRGRSAVICTGLASLSLGLATAQQAHFRYAADEIGQYTTQSQRFAFVRLRLVDPPRLLAGSDLGRPRSPRLVTMGEALAVKTWDGWRPASGRVLVRLSGDHPSLGVGDVLEVFGVLERPAAASNPGQFDFAGYYRGRRVLAGVSVDSPDNVVLLSRSTSSIDRFWQSIEDWRVEARRCLVAGFGAEHRSRAQLLRAMLLGDRDPAMSDIRDAFRDSGTSHYLAVSGLHVGIVGGAAFVLARILRARLRVATLIAAAVVAGYAILAVPSPPILRATILALAVAIGVLTGRRAGGVQLVSLVAIVLLVLAPLDLYRAGFQLSFVTVLALVLFAESFRRRLGVKAGEPVALATRPQLILAGRWLDNRILNGVVATIVAWVASMPLVALHFGQFNPWAVPASLAAAPFVALSLLGGVAKICMTYLLPGQAGLWATLAGWPVGAMHAVVDAFAALPRAKVPLPPPSLILVVAFYVSLLLLRVHWRWATLRWLNIGALATCFVLIFVAPFLGPAVRWQPDDQELRVTVLAVGAGQCVVLESPGGDVTLIDAGSMSLGDPLGKAIEPFLRHRGHVDADRLVLSHANFDHYSAAAEVVAAYGVADVVVAASFFEDALEMPTGETLLGELGRLNRPPRSARIGDVIPLGRQTTLTVLWPPAETQLDPNDASMVIRLEHAGRRMLFTGDLQRDGMVQLLDLAIGDPDLLRADVLMAPHHGSTESVTPAFLEAVGAGVVISSNSRALSQKQRRLVGMVEQADLLRTHESGAITLLFSGEGELLVEEFRQTRKRTLTVVE